MGFVSFILFVFVTWIYLFQNETFANANDCPLPTKTSMRVNPFKGKVDNPKIVPEHDCALRAFTIEMAAYIAPPSSKANWTILSQSAFQMNKCNSSTLSTNSAKPFKTAQELPKGACQYSIFVDDTNGNDSSNGTFEKPMKSIEAALSLMRSLRIVYGHDSILCITIREGIYYLGTNATTSSSQIGAIELTTADSNLIIENYQDERVILSGGTLLKLEWSVHEKRSDGGTILKAQIPSWINLDEFNELYIDERRAIVAKYPNGDPSTQGLYSDNPGYSSEIHGWVPPIRNPSLDIHVDNPSRNGTVFTNYQVGVGGGASVFNPPMNFWSTASPPAGDNYVVPRGIIVNNGSLPHQSNWTKPTTGFVHTFHGEGWGSWIFEITGSNDTQNTVLFGRGGFQEARGLEWGSLYYIANLFEELDSPNEWFLDKDTRTLYFMPNDTIPNIFVASQIPCLISISGSTIQNPVRNIVIQGLILTQTSNTYMKDYMVPSGGDWAVHRGGTIFLTNTKNVTITQNLFTQLGSNGIAVIDYNDATVITLNEFVWLADSGIILVGSTNGIDGFSVASQPNNTLIQSNLIHEIGIYVKQSSPVLIAISRSASIIGNLMFNVPRAAININDGFYGNHTLSWNVMFNTVRETGDHGPINTWDRQPYLSDSAQSGVPSLWQHYSYIHHNVVYNNYNCLWPIDHDDGSSFYEDSYNFIVYGGKKNFLGHSKIDHHEIYVYADANPGDYGSNICMGDYAPTKGASGWNETWIENICILYKNPVPYNIGGCDTSNLFLPYLADNKIYIPSDTEVAFICKVNGNQTQLNLQQWQSYGIDIGTIVETTPDIQTIIQWGRDMLQH